MYKKETLKLKKIDNQTIIQGVDSNDLLNAPKFEEIILESGNQTSRSNGETYRDTTVLLKMSLDIGGLSSTSNHFEDHIKIVIMQSDKQPSANRSEKIYENFIKDSGSYSKDGDMVFFEISTILREKDPTELSFYAFAYFDLTSFVASAGSNQLSNLYVGDITK